MPRFEYKTSCVESTGPTINSMTRAAREVSFRTFAERCNWQPWAKSVGYSIGSEPGLKLKDDFHPAYFKSTFKGKPCYYVVWSAIEYIFTADEDSIRDWRSRP